MARQTAQRRAILQALAEAPGPLTPQQVRVQASRQLEGLGLATVYRNLNLLERQGEVVPVYLPGEGVRFEPAGRAHHHHFRCGDCDVVFELHDACPLLALEDTLLPGGFQVIGHDLMLYGLCPQCRGEQRAP